jgi:hypothetical protein
MDNQLIIHNHRHATIFSFKSRTVDVSIIGHIYFQEEKGSVIGINIAHTLR